MVAAGILNDRRAGEVGRGFLDRDDVIAVQLDISQQPSTHALDGFHRNDG